MKDSTSANGRQTVNVMFTPRVVGLCQAHGLWDGRDPKGEMEALLKQGVRRTCPGSRSGEIYECDRQVVRALFDLACGLQESMRNSGCGRKDGAVVAQWCRRIGEVLARAGASSAANLLPKPAPSAQQPVTVKTAPPKDIFAPPPLGVKATEAHAQKVWKCLTDFVDFTQTATYSEGAAA